MFRFATMDILISMFERSIWLVTAVNVVIITMVGLFFWKKTHAPTIPLQEEQGVEESKPEESGPCEVSGCSSQLCIGPVEAALGMGGSTCEWKEEYICYRGARCERQQNGQCGWTETPELITCREEERKKEQALPETPSPEAGILPQFEGELQPW